MDINVGGMSVFIGMPVYGHIPPDTALSLARTANLCGAGDVSLEICMEVRGVLQWGRDAVFDSFLRSDKQKLFWIDSDIAWAPEDFMRLVALSSLRGVVCGSYPTRADPMTFQFGAAAERVAMDDLGLMPIDGIGLGFTIMDRAICEQLAAKATSSFDAIKKREMKDIFRFDVHDGQRRGEDIAFFADIRALGHDVYLDPTITLGHVGEKMWTGRAIDSLKRIDHAQG